MTHRLFKSAANSLFRFRSVTNSHNFVSAPGTVTSFTLSPFEISAFDVPDVFIYLFLTFCIVSSGFALQSYVQRECRRFGRYYGSTATVIERNSSFSKLNSDDASYFKELLGQKSVVEDEDALLTANTDWMRKYKGSSKLLLQPKNTHEVQFFSSHVILNIYMHFFS